MAEQGSGHLVFVGDADDLRKVVGVAPPPAPSPDEGKESVTTHEVTIAGRSVPYRATAGTMAVGLEDKDQPRGRLFHVSYVRTDVDPVGRPVTFCFNGGPGSSAVWLHMGLFGPRRVRIDATALPRPGAVAEDNDRSLLDVTDLVFVDPMSTGYSRADKGPGEAYHSMKTDVESVADFVRRWTTKNGRWASPKVVAGESYGTTRAASLARHLQSRHGLFLNGLVLVSVALKFQSLMMGDDGNDLPFVLFVPSYAATAAFHGKADAGGDLDAFLARAERWAYDRYLPALSRGSSLPDADRDRIARELAAFVGVDADYVLRCNLRVDLGRFCRELLRDRRRSVGRLDSRFVGEERDGAGERAESDPTLPALMSAYASAFHHDLKHRLKYEDDEVYEFLNFKANEAWKWEQTNRYVDVTGDLRQAMTDNPHLAVFAASGLYDLATPPAAADYTFAHLGLEARDRVVHHRYPAGHMMYVHEPSMDQLRADLVAFYLRCAP